MAQEFPVATLPAPGVMAVDWEERVNFDRLRDYRLERTREQMRAAGIGALLLFETSNIRYTTSTTIGYWAFNKSERWAVVTATGQPKIWDFGSAARAHRLQLPSLYHDHNSVAGNAGLQGAIGPRTELHKRAVAEIHDWLKEAGVENEPLGVDVAETAMFLELLDAGLTVVDGQQVMMMAREIKNQDEIMLITQATAMVDAVYQDILEALKPGVRESDIVALAHHRLFELGSEFVEAINSIAGERCSPHPHVFSDRIIRPGDQAYFDIIHAFNGYRTCYYRTFGVGRATQPQRDAFRQSREWMDAALA
ncbi:MAG: M24 family metallopeptidase, partial [Acidimicrobiales bacterium]